jgi:hypothetical protein
MERFGGGGIVTKVLLEAGWDGTNVAVLRTSFTPAQAMQPRCAAGSAVATGRHLCVSIGVNPKRIEAAKVRHCLALRHIIGGEAKPGEPLH